jgi:Trypsin-like peptidase domain
MFACRLLASVLGVVVLQSFSAGAVIGIGSEPGPRPQGHPLPKAQELTSEQRDQLEKAAMGLKPSVLIVGCHPNGDNAATPVAIGTAFVISRKDRLIATAAHVADRIVDSGHLVASTGIASVRLRVERAYYHPRLRRQLDEGLCAYTMDPNDGRTANPTIDVAVLRVLDDGVELPDACVLATDDELRGLSNRPFGMLGYPESDGDDWHWPTKSKQVTASLLISTLDQPVAYRGERTEERAQDPSAVEMDRRWVRSSEALGYGASGGPLFLPNGHVFAVLVGGGSEFVNNEWQEFHESNRTDAIREIMAHHRIGIQVAVEHARLLQSNAPIVDDRLPRLRQAVALSRRSDFLRVDGRYREAGTLCNEAIQLAPEYGRAFLRRANVYLSYCQSQWGQLRNDERQRYASMARKDVERWRSLDPLWREEAKMIEIYSELYASYADPDRQSLARGIECLDILITWHEGRNPEGTKYRAALVNARAQFRELSKDFLGALKDYSQAIPLDPDEPRWLVDRANFWNRRGRQDFAADDRAKAERLLERRPPVVPLGSPFDM